MKGLLRKTIAVVLSLMIVIGAFYICNEQFEELLKSFSVKAEAYSTGDDYPYRNYCNGCHNTSWGDDHTDISIYGFYYRQCTDFVAWCLNSRNGINFKYPAGYGNAKTWVNAATNAGVTVNQTPAIGAVACWTSGTYGHVAWVKEVNSNGTVNIEEYNYNNATCFGTRNNITAPYYIHIKDIHTCDYKKSAKITKAPTKTATGTRVRTCSCGKTYTQTIPAIPYTTDLKEGVYSIRSKANSNLVLATNKSSSYNIFVAESNSSWSDQYWILIKNSDGTYSFENMIYNNYYMDVYNNSMVNNGNIIAYPKKTTNNSNEKFYLVPSGNYYKIVNQLSYNIVDVDKPTSSNIVGGANVQMYEDLGGDNQQWNLKLSNPSLTLSATSVSINQGSSKTVNCTLGLEMKGNNLTASIANTNICSVSWGSWDGKTRPITITAKAAGTTKITITNKDTDTGIVFATKTITITVPDTTKPSASITSTNTVTTSQTATLKLTDNLNLAGYYWGTNSSYSSNTYTAVSGTSKSVTKTISAAGTYYLTAKDAAGYVSSTVSKTFYKTTLNASSGSVSPASVITMSGNSFALPTPTRSGFTFKNWNTKSDGTGTSYAAGASYKPTGNATLYAQWKDSTKPTAAITSTNNIAASQTATLTVSDNSGLAGYYWGTSSTYSDNTYTTLSGTSKSVTKAISASGTYYLTAKDSAGNVSSTVSKTFYKTTLNANGGSVSPASVITLSGYSFALPAPARSEYEFLSWNTKSDGTGTEYNAGDSFKPTGNITLYAQWNKIDTSAPVVLITSTNDVAPAQTVTITMSDNEELAGYYWGTTLNNTQDNYTALSGKTAETNIIVSSEGTYYLTVLDGAGQSTTKSITFHETKLYPQGETVSPETILSSEASKNTTYSGSSVGVFPETETRIGSDFMLPLPERAGYIFKGWNTEPDGTGKTYDAGELFHCYKYYEKTSSTSGGISFLSLTESETELYAQWEEIHVHSYTEEVIEPTCTEMGYTVKTCSCGDSETTDFIPPLDHSFTNYIYNNDATTESDGTETAKCDRCDVTDTRIKPDTKLHSHSFVSETFAPNCAENGYTLYTCSCGESYTAEYKSAFGHDFKKYTYNNDATTEKDGTETAKCSRCDATDTREKPGTKLKSESSVNPTAKAKINVAKATDLDYRTKLAIKATATNLDAGYHLVLVINGKEIEGNNKEVTYDYGEVTDDVNYFVKVVDTSGIIQKDANGAELKKDGGKITCNAGFLKKLIAFVKGLFGLLPKKTVQP